MGNRLSGRRNNFSTRLAQLTKTAVSKGPTGDPRPLIVRPIDDALFRCGFVMLWRAESLSFSVEDATRMRDYLLKGGFIWSDDSWGSYAWDKFALEMGKVLSPSQFPFVDIPPDHALFARCFMSRRFRGYQGSVTGWEPGAAHPNGAPTAQT